MNSSVWLAYTVAFLITLLAGFGLLATKSLHGRFTYDQSHGVQRFHEDPTPRIGGLALVLGVGCVILMGPALGVNFQGSLVWPVLLAAIPAFASGLAEDVLKNVAPPLRLFATMVSALLAAWLTGVTLDRLDVPLLDPLLGYALISVPLTAIAVSGVAHSINIIDGFHGLAGGVIVIICSAIALVALQVGDVQLALLCGLLAASMLGFLALNFPFGKIFLGDGGAYFSGFLAGWLALLLPARNPDVSPWASLLICAYPISETLFSMYRRLRDRLSISQPDREHLHSLLKIVLIRPLFRSWSANLQNAAVSPILWMLAAAPVLVAILAYRDTKLLFVAFLVFCLVYGIFYQPLASRAAILRSIEGDDD